MMYDRSPAFPIGQEVIIGCTIGVLGGLLTLVAASAIHPAVAIALPIAAVLGSIVVAHPSIGALLLILMIYLDGIAERLFFFSPISGFKLCTAATILGLILSAYKNRDHLHQAFRQPTTLWIMGFSGAWLIAILFAQSKSSALDWGPRLMTIKLIFFIVLAALNTPKRVTLGVLFVAMASGISAIILIADTLLGTILVSTSEAATTARSSEGFDRSSGASQENPTTAATMLLCGTIIALVHTIESPKWRKAMAACAFLGTSAVVLSFARSAAVVYVIILILLAVRYGQYQKFAPIAVILCICAVAMLPFVPPEYFSRITSIFNAGSDWTLGRRMTYNVIGIDLLTKYPVFGVGPGNFYNIFPDPEYRDLPGRTLFSRQLHNMYLSVAVDYGLFGFTFFMGMILSAFGLLKAIVATPANDDFRALAVALHYGMIAYYIVSVFVPNEYIKYTWLLPALATTTYMANRSLLTLQKDTL